MVTPVETNVEHWAGYVLSDPERTKLQFGPEFEQQGEWRALEQVVAPCWRLDFMVMGILDPAAEIYSYKHRITREYLNVDLATQFYVYRGGQVRTIERSEVCSALIPQLSQIAFDVTNVTLG